MSLSAGSSAPRIQVFRPTMEQFKHFSKYIEYIESTGAHKAGLAKIIPPEGWIPRKSGYEDVDIMIPHPICQLVTGSQGLYQQLNISQKGLTAKEFRKLAESRKFKTPTHFDYEDLERKYWKNITYNSPIYGADVSGSLYDDGVEEFNIQRLNTILDLVKEDYEIQIEGVNTAYLYFGMWKTTFAWHTEDMDLYSINYVHYGAPKSWYVIPPEHGRRLERLAAGFFHGSHSECPAFLRHKMTIISPHILKKYSIPFSKITQEPGEFMITFPYAYHSGFNHGFNIAESTNFALPRWVEYGKRSFPCTCRNDCVKICMDVFIKKFQPDRYELWKIGKDIGAHPEDPSRQYAAPAPRKTDLALSAQRERRRMREMQRIKRHPISKMNDAQEQKPKFNQSNISIPESDEETTVYDINEVLAPEKESKKRRKSSKKVSIKRMKSDEAEEEMLVKNEIKMEQEFKTEFANMQQVKDEVMDDEEKSEEIDADYLEAKLDTSTESEAYGIPNENANFLVTNNVYGDNNDGEMPKEAREDMPPELTPFWDPDVVKNEENKKVISSNNDNTILFNSKVKFLQGYPNLHKAVNAGAFSVVPLNSSNTCTKMKFESLSNQDAGPSHSDTSQIPCPVFSPNWRCEQTNNGLKIKFVQPKKPTSSVLTPIALQTPLKSFEISKGTSAESSATPQTPIQSVDSSHQANVEYESNNQSSSNESSCKPFQLFKRTICKSKKRIKKTIKQQNNIDTSWALPLKNLWQYEPKNFEAEVAYNERLAAISPHCAVCVLFTPMYNSNNFPSESAPVPSYSAVKMPAFCYGKSHNEIMIDTNSLITQDGTAPLLTCSRCKICVHAPCYGISLLPMSPWLCARCSNNAYEAECCLCVLRGGILKPTMDNRWAHIVCTALIEETYFENISKKQPANVANLTNARTHLKCKYCFKTSLFKKLKGACVQCRSGKCFESYHVTCGYMAGVIFEISDWPNPIRMICTKHVAARRKPLKRNLTNVSNGDFVIVKNKKNKRYYWARVHDQYNQEYYSILFEDNSHSTNTLPEDIVSRDVTIDGRPEINEKVQVKWSDGEIYNGMFKGSQNCKLYVIEFDDGTFVRLERKEFYSRDENIPKSVQSKVSHSSERRTVDFDSEVDGKRVRTINHKYS